ncbi:MAG TPA: histone deacetylase family protein [Thermodesulfobacteriota bacterium]|nr:histone deacetylase family protein [Thermodesulfobacteriota bacterium]
MKVIFHERFYEVYTGDPAAAPGRMEAIMAALGKDFEFKTPSAASDKDLALVHTRRHIEGLKRQQEVYEVGALSAGGAIQASDLAWEGEPAFGLIRPPGHHASPDSCWGFCYFNNIAIAIHRLRKQGKVKKALILDFDLHFGDGTENVFIGNPAVDYFHPEGTSPEDFIRTIQNHLERAGSFDILAVSAGFDRHAEDWGGLLATGDYGKIGSLVKTYSQKICQGRRFAVLEGGYNHDVLGHNVRAFIEGMK